LSWSKTFVVKEIVADPAAVGFPALADETSTENDIATTNSINV